ncbi:hypothetical protein [Streptomyces anulatus]|uniref:hypothetical protein n=1 Tax=Streptomyces anulatus TaxID=1892 RepID=UPI0037DCDDE6|nr:hypothetical protein OHB50_39300 [Streptomyces anulatus]
MSGAQSSSVLEALVPDGWELGAEPHLVQRYEDATDLTRPLEAIGTPGTATCPRCQGRIEWSELDTIFARGASLFGVAEKCVATLLYLGPCGHAFRIAEGQTLLEVREAQPT